MKATVALLLALAALPVAISQPALAPPLPGAAPAPALSAPAAASAPAPEPADGLGAAAGSVPLLFPGQSQVRVAVTPGGAWYSNCDEYGGDPANLTGWEVATSRELLRRMGVPEAAVAWVCVDDSTNDQQPLEDLAAGRVDLKASHRLVTADVATYTNLSRGPVIDLSAFQAVVLATPPGAATGSWALLQAFSPALWLALLGTALGAGLLAFLVEVATQNLHADAESGCALVWDALGRFSQARDMVGFSNSASILVLAFSFLCYILCALFTATMASRLTASQLRTGITSMADLAGRRVAMGDDYLRWALQYGVRFEDVVPYASDTWDNPAWYPTDLPALLAQLRAGAIDALLLDIEDSKDVLAQNCDLVGLPQFDMDYYYPVLRPGVGPQALRALAAATLGMLQDGSLGQITDTYFGQKRPACNTGADDASVAVTFDQVACLWILLGAGAAGSLLLVLLHLWQNRWWPMLRERPWVRTHLLRDGKAGSCCGLRAPPNVLAHAMHAFEAATAPYQLPADRLPLTAGDSQQPCSSGAGSSSDGSSFKKSQQAEPPQAGGTSRQSAEQRAAAAEQRRANEERREAACSALPAQLHTGAVGEVARTYSRLNSAQGFVINRLLRRVCLRSYD